ncbi:TIGR04222 domain-containing membrane protein [Actinophytocola oryzae]|uniref:Uncharacterized protein (TIGR04222 family) n=1 Tax=Actinophytocola oryzae TaxID=502181 RepID=A0A4V3FV37_9PSEU|nr:TIGR04222 domain-containing membrane protein [Actinophytocola oryzae]TDV57571.1 uncharacterized protein (TIGR04222 family) [Actinophytocola oryzae]
MNGPFGLPVPMFLLLYGIAILASVAYAELLRHRLWAPRVTDTSAVDRPALLAYLDHGADRVVEVALVRLVGSGAVRVSRKGNVSATTKEVSNPLDQVVLDAIGRRPRPVHQVVERTVRLPSMTGLDDMLRRKRLRVHYADSDRALRRGLVAPFVLLGIGVVAFVMGLFADYPVGFLLLEIVVGAAVVGLPYLRQMPYVTVHGERLRAAVRESAGPADLVALHGLAWYPDAEVASALQATRYPPPPPRPAYQPAPPAPRPPAANPHGSTAFDGAYGRHSGFYGGGLGGAGGCGGGGAGCGGGGGGG